MTCPKAKMTSNLWRERILSDPQILRGKPCIKGTRIPVAVILGYLAGGSNAGAIVREFPGLTLEDVAACLDYARDLAGPTTAAYSRTLID
jgi:uncharacterized protein (DUF433 family)